MGGVLAATDFWWTLEDKYPLAKMFVDAFNKKYGYRPEWGAENAYMQFAIWARMVSEAGTFYPPDVIKQLREGRNLPLHGGRRPFPPRGSSLVRPVVIVRGKQPKDMKNNEDYWEVLEVVPGAAADAEAGCLRLQSRRLHLTANECLLRIDDAEKARSCSLAGSKARSIRLRCLRPGQLPIARLCRCPA